MHTVATSLLRARGWMTRHRVLIVSVLALLFLAVFKLTFATSGSEWLDDTGVLELLMSWLTAILMGIMWGIGQFILLMIGMVIIPILGYNNFGDSSVIDIGWPLVRDVVNMFVIVVLLLIAVRTILGVGNAKWQQQIPRLFLAVIAVNFSRTISLLMIDASQVVMFTFVNALQSIAAGNFITLFQVDKFLTLSPTAAEQALGSASAVGAGFKAVGLLASAYVTLMLMIALLGALILLAVAFLYRIIVLWILVILSPIAFFLGGIKDVLGQAGGRYAEWWKMFTGALMLGPILTFFLWLSLAVASQGAISSVEKFPTNQSEDSSQSIYTEIFELDKLTSFFIAFVLLIAGFKVASESATAIGGIAAKAVNEGIATKGVKAIAGAHVGGAVRAARFGGRQAERRWQVGSKMGAAITRRGGNIPLVGGKIAQLGASVEKGSRASTAQAMAKSQERFSDMSDSQKLQALQKRGDTKFQGGRDDYSTSAAELVTNKGMQDDMKKQIAAQGGHDMDTTEGKAAVKEAFDKEMDAAIAHVDAREKKAKDDPNAEPSLIGGDETKKRAWNKTKTGNMHKMGMDDAEKRKMIDDDDFLPENLHPDALNDPAIVEALREKVVGTKFNKETGAEEEIFALDRLAVDKKASKELRAAARGVKSGERTAEEREAMVVRDDDDAATRATRLGAALSEEGGAARVAAELTDPDAAITVESITISDFNADTEGMTRAIAESGMDLSDLDEGVRTAFKYKAGDMRDSGSAADRRTLDRARFSATNNVEHLGVQTDGSIAAGSSRTVRDEIKARPVEAILQMRGQIDLGGNDSGGNDTTKAIVESITQEDLDSMLSKFESSTDDAVKVNLRDAMKNVQDALQGEIDRAVGEGNADMERSLQSRLERAQLMRNEMT